MLLVVLALMEVLVLEELDLVSSSTNVSFVDVNVFFFF